jgi:hypothetical protein
MSENLIENVAPHLAPPVTREPIQSANEVDEGAGLSIPALLFIPFAADDAE